LTLYVAPWYAVPRNNYENLLLLSWFILAYHWYNLNFNQKASKTQQASFNPPDLPTQFVIFSPAHTILATFLKTMLQFNHGKVTLPFFNLISQSICTISISTIYMYKNRFNAVVHTCTCIYLASRNRWVDWVQKQWLEVLSPICNLTLAWIKTVTVGETVMDPSPTKMHFEYNLLDIEKIVN